MAHVAWHDASAGGHNVEIYVRRAPPELRVTPSCLAFLVEGGEVNPAPRTINVSNIGITVTYSATVSPTLGWIDITPHFGTTPATITATVNVSGLSISKYRTTLALDGGEGMLNSPRIVDVRLIVAEEIYRVYLPFVLRE